MRTTIDINDGLLRDLRERARNRGKSLREVVDEILAVGLGQISERKGTKPFRVTPRPLGLKPGFQGISLNQLYDQLEAENDAGSS